MGKIISIIFLAFLLKSVTLCENKTVGNVVEDQSYGSYVLVDNQNDYESYA